MVKRSRGYLSKYSRKLKAKRKLTVNDFIKDFKVGDRVYIDPVPYYKRGQIPHKRYKGKVGKIVEVRGNAYVVEIKIGGKTFKPVILPIHLKAMEG